MLNHLEQFFDSLWEKLLSGRKDIAEDPSANPAVTWDSWELDPKFFKALSRWTVDHPDSPLDAVLQRICDGIDSGRDLLELIPDSPFPARSLVKALGCLLKLGTAVSRAQADVQEFAKEIVHWVGEMRAAFESRRGGRFTFQTKKNLAKIRSLIDEICRWATARLNDGRWSSFMHGLTIAQEIDEFKARITSSRALFTNTSIINISQGLDAVIEEIGKVRQLQEVQLKAIDHKLDKLVAQKQAEERRQFLIQTLFKRNVADATYDEQGKLPCDEDTRTGILADIKTWIYDVSVSSQSFLWLTGDPGSGKSAITASVARECKDNSILWAQFFISRNDSNTTDPRSYFPSIARQLADHIPDSAVALAIHDALKIKPSLVDDITAEQASKLFLDALDTASQLDPKMPVVVVIDGLDETDRPRLGVTADIFSTLFSKLRCRNAKVFISSRTEDDIQKPFSKAFHVRHVNHIHLHTTADSSIQDVSTFLRRRIGDIVVKHDLNWEVWPGEDRMQALCHRASGLFIWGATVVKFFQEQIEIMGRECLNDLVDAVSAQGMGDINMLYGAILHLMYKDRKDPWVFETFRRVVGCIVVLREPLSLAEIDGLLDLRQVGSSDRVDTQHFVRRLRTVLVAGTDAIDGRTVPRLHKSFFEFITSEHADEHFRVDISISNGELAVQCLLQLASVGAKASTTYDSDLSGPRMDPLPSGPGYALQFWSSHLLQDTTATSGVAMIGGSFQLYQLRDLLQLSSSDLNSSVLLNVALSPDRAHVAMSGDHIIRRWNRTSGQPIDEFIPGHTARVWSVAFSPDGKRVASGSDDNTIRIWDSHNGQPVGLPFQGHTDWVRSVAFSPDGKRVVSGSGDNTVRIWDSQTGQLIGSPFQGHTHCVRSVAFSPDGKRVVSGSGDHTIRIWDAQTGQPIGPPFGTSSVWSVAFSPDGKRVVSGGDDNKIWIWGSYTGQLIESFQGHTSYVCSVVFAPDGKRVVSGSGDGTIRVWDCETGSIGLPFRGHTACVRSVAFSSDGKRVVSGSADNTIRIWDSHTGKPIGPPIPARVPSVAFSPDGKQIVTSHYHHVLFWDLQNKRLLDTSRMRSLAYSPDATHIVSLSAGDTILSWDLKSRLPTGISRRGLAKELVSVTISPDGTRIAIASLNGTVYLLNAATRLLTSPPTTTSIDGFTSLAFSSDGSRLVLASLDGRACVMNVADGKPITQTASSDAASGGFVSFNLKQGWKCGEKDGDLLRWFPSGDPNVGLWAYIDGKVIACNGPTSVTIVDLDNVLKKRGAPV